MRECWTASPRFVRHPNHHTIKKVDENDEEIGKALPDLVIRQLDAHDRLLGQNIPYGGLPAEAVKAMLRTAYVVLRDTGRRPAEVAGLDLNCLEFDNRALREERDRLKAAVQRGLGQQVGQASPAELVSRIDELTAANQELADKLARAEADRDGLQSALTEAQDDLIATRQDPAQHDARSEPLRRVTTRYGAATDRSLYLTCRQLASGWCL